MALAALSMAALLAAAPARAAAVLDLEVVASGKAVAVRDVVAQGPALIAFWATYCPPCRAEVPVLGRAARRWRRDGLVVLAVLVDVEGARRLEEVRREWGIEVDAYAVAPGQDDRLAALLPSGLPTSFVVDHGRVTRHDRFLSDRDLEDMIPPLLVPQAAPLRTRGTCVPDGARHAGGRHEIAGGPAWRGACSASLHQP